MGHRDSHAVLMSGFKQTKVILVTQLLSHEGSFVLFSLSLLHATVHATFSQNVISNLSPKDFPCDTLGATALTSSMSDKR